MRILVFTYKLHYVNKIYTHLLKSVSIQVQLESKKGQTRQSVKITCFHRKDRGREAFEAFTNELLVVVNFRGGWHGQYRCWHLNNSTVKRVYSQTTAVDLNSNSSVTSALAKNFRGKRGPRSGIQMRDVLVTRRAVRPRLFILFKYEPRSLNFTLS